MKKVFSLISLFLLSSCSLNQQKTDYAFQITNYNKSVSVLLRADGIKASGDELRIETLSPMVEHTFPSLLPLIDQLDSEETPYNVGEFEQPYVGMETNVHKNGKILQFFKYTFYVKNTSDADTSLNIKFNIGDEESTDGARNSISDTLRFMIFENESADIHSYSTYAKRAAENHTDKEGNRTDREFLARCSQNDQEDDEHPLVTKSFISNKCCAEYLKENFEPNQQLRYTMVVWLEGEDPQSRVDAEYPQGESLKLSVDISL